MTSSAQRKFKSASFWGEKSSDLGNFLHFGHFFAEVYWLLCFLVLNLKTQHVASLAISEVRVFVNHGSSPLPTFLISKSDLIRRRFEAQVRFFFPSLIEVTGDCENLLKKNRP